MLAGITRDSVITLAGDLGIDVEERDLPRESLYSADEVFITGTAAEVTPIRSVDRKPIGDGKPGPITRALQDAFFGLVRWPDRRSLALADSGHDESWTLPAAREKQGQGSLTFEREVAA